MLMSKPINLDPVNTKSGLTRSFAEGKATMLQAMQAIVMEFTTSSIGCIVVASVTGYDIIDVPSTLS